MLCPLDFGDNLFTETDHINVVDADTCLSKTCLTENLLKLVLPDLCSILIFNVLYNLYIRFGIDTKEYLIFV